MTQDAARPAVTRLVLVRHAQTDGNAQGVTQGRRDVPLNEAGVREAHAVAASLHHALLEAIYSSPAIRALDTARHIAEPHGLDVTVDDRLHEMDQGVLDGLTGAELHDGHAEFLARWRGEDPTDLRMPGGETMGEVQARMLEACTAIAGAHPGAEVVVVSHNFALRALLCHVLGVPLGAFRRIRHDLGAVAVIEARPDDPWTVVTLNERCHLPPPEGAPRMDAASAD